MNKSINVNLTELVSGNKIKFAKSYLENARLLLNDKFQFQHVYDMEPCSKIIDLKSWQISPNGDPEWLYMLKRQEYLQDLLYSYLRTDDIKYLVKSKEFIFDWIINNDEDKSVRFNSWRTIDTGIRLLNWAKPLSYIIKKKIIDNEEINRINNSVKRQTKYLYENYIEKYDLSNWGILITTGMLTFDAEHPNIIDKKIIRWSLKKFELELNIQIDETGIHWEQSPLYFFEVFRSSLCVVAIYLAKNKTVSPNILSLLNKMLKVCPYFIKPNGKLLQQGDTDEVEVNDLLNSAYWILHGITSRRDPVDFLIMSLANDATIEVDQINQITQNSFDSITSGNFYFQDSLNKDYWHIFNGNIGSGHGHAAAGHLDLVLNQNDIFVDPGRYTYIDSKQRRFLKSGFSHNTILIDNTFPIIPINSWQYKNFLNHQNNEVQHNEIFDSVKCSYLIGKHKYLITRYFIWIREFEIMVIIDVVEYSGHHKQTDNWILNPVTKISNIDQNKILLNLNNNEYAMFHSFDKNEIKKQIFSPRYNKMQETLKIELSKEFVDYSVSYIVIGLNKKIDSVFHLISMKNLKNDYTDINNFGIKILLNSKKSIIIDIQHKNTSSGNRIYYVDDIPFYGNISVCC